MNMANDNVTKIIGGFIAILVGVVLLPVLDSTITAGGFTGTLATVTSLITVLFGVGLIVMTVKGMVE